MLFPSMLSSDTCCALWAAGGLAEAGRLAAVALVRAGLLLLIAEEDGRGAVTAISAHGSESSDACGLRVLPALLGRLEGGRGWDCKKSQPFPSKTTMDQTRCVENLRNLFLGRC